MVLHIVDAVVRVQVLVQSNLENGSRSLSVGHGSVSERIVKRVDLPAGNGSRRQEVRPSPEPFLAVLGENVVLVAEPVLVPPPESGRVVNAEDVNVLDLEPCVFHCLEVPVQRARSISAREHIFVHEETPGRRLAGGCENGGVFSPNKVLVSPSLTEPRDLVHEGTIIIQEIINLLHKLSIAPDADVFTHLQRHNLVELGASRDLPVVAAQNPSLVRRNSILRDALRAKLGLVLAQSDAGSVDTVVLGGVCNEGSPTASDVEELVTGLESELFTDGRELVVLHLLEGLFDVRVADDAGGVDHAWAEEPFVEVVST